MAVLCGFMENPSGLHIPARASPPGGQGATGRPEALAGPSQECANRLGFRQKRPITARVHERGGRAWAHGLRAYGLGGPLALVASLEATLQSACIVAAAEPDEEDDDDDDDDDGEEDEKEEDDEDDDDDHQK